MKAQSFTLRWCLFLWCVCFFNGRNRKEKNTAAIASANRKKKYLLCHEDERLRMEMAKAKGISIEKERKMLD